MARTLEQLLPIKDFDKKKVKKVLEKYLAPECFKITEEDRYLKIIADYADEEEILVYKSLENSNINYYDDCDVCLIAFKNIKDLKKLLLEYFNLNAELLINEKVQIVDYGNAKVKLGKNYVTINTSDYYTLMKFNYDENGNLESIDCSLIALAKEIIEKFNLTKKPNIKNFIKKYNLKYVRDVGGDLYFVGEDEEKIIKVIIFEDKYRTNIEASGYYYGDKYEYTFYFYVDDAYKFWKELGINQ